MPGGHGVPYNVLRDGEQLSRIRRYIHENPWRWELDRENPAAKVVEDKEPWE